MVRLFNLNEKFYTEVNGMKRKILLLITFLLLLVTLGLTAGCGGGSSGGGSGGTGIVGSGN